MAKVYNCSDCDYCYSNNTMGEAHICVNGESEYLGKFVDWLGLAEDDMDCVVMNGQSPPPHKGARLVTSKPSD